MRSAICFTLVNMPGSVVEPALPAIPTGSTTGSVAWATLSPAQTRLEMSARLSDAVSNLFYLCQHARRCRRASTTGHPDGVNDWECGQGHALTCANTPGDVGAPEPSAVRKESKTENSNVPETNASVENIPLHPPCLLLVA